MNQFTITELEDIIRKEHSNIVGIAMRKKNELFYEKYFNNCNTTSKTHIYSITKSIVSALIGIAIEQGYIKSVDQKILDFFPDYTAKKQSKINEVTLKHLLTMTAAFQDSLDYMAYFTSDDWVSFTLERLEGNERHGTFQYTPLIGPDLLTGILTKATGQSVLSFATTHLFSPLNISVERSILFQNAQEQMAFNEATDISAWVSDQTGINTGGWGLTLSATDMAKIGQLYLNGGMWCGKQIVPSAWITESTREQSRWYENNLAYGYLWWIIDESNHACAAMGDGGNAIYFNTEKDLVISIAALYTQDGMDSMSLIREQIEPLFS